MDNLRLLTRVQISGAAGVCVGRIEDIRPIDELPLFADIPTIDIMREWGVSRVAFVSYFMTRDEEMAFFALEIDGEWFDLQRQALTFEVIGQARVN